MFPCNVTKIYCAGHISASNHLRAFFKVKSPAHRLRFHSCQRRPLRFPTKRPSPPILANLSTNSTRTSMLCMEARQSLQSTKPRNSFFLQKSPRGNMSESKHQLTTIFAIRNFYWDILPVRTYWNMMQKC